MKTVQIVVLLSLAVTLVWCVEAKGAGVDETLELPEVGGGEGKGTPLKLGERVKLDHIGPLVINKDGSTRRVTNWEAMTEQEREVAYKRITERNRERIKNLKEKLEREKPDDL
eukprot:TRINITY_DN7000_c0_g2_i1.p1 TRINITY_DN7000_c0_g2~~TRINITY_DN7000_c0_g2_i1.p1  ORF type:complete len:113 (+),score=27.08 TRINITY_DN7000_c0_g2_i1:47-385(+)